jgi:hypothetical protein
MNNQEIVGMNSAYEHAKQCAYGANMSISAALVVDMTKRIAELEKELYVREVYIKHALDNSKESLIGRIVTLEQAHTDRVVRIEALEKECDGKNGRIV